MGTWGPRNFDNDGAADFFAEEVQSPLLAHVERIIDDPSAIELDEEGESVLMPCIDLLATLAETYGGDFASPEVVRQWRDTYLAVYDGYIDKLSPKPAYKAERRRVIEQTFDRLERACTDAESA